jgi:hypothetical protein
VVRAMRRLSKKLCACSLVKIKMEVTFPIMPNSPTTS